MEQNIAAPDPQNIEDHVDQLGRTLAKLEDIERRLAEPRMTPGEVVFRDPRDTYHQITLGAVLTAHGMSAHDARRLDGLLSLQLGELERLADDLADFDSLVEPGHTVGQALVRFLSMAAGQLEAGGRYAEWRRAFDRYQDRTRAYLEAPTDEKLEELRRRPISRKQTELVRYTCACLGLEFPALKNRGEAFEWLHEIGANPRYRAVAR